MSTITKEWLQRKIKEFKSWSEDIPFGLDEDVHNMLAALEIALASLEAEPVAWMYANNGIGIPAITRSKDVADSWRSKGWNVLPLYSLTRSINLCH
ncbi:hypothetical protein DPU22_18330 [Salmonella enterica subsp. enterica serovar Newport]|uniref:DUF551 domain-containing protein n=1 Tax=Salmonella enterica I TaxID=59201 RepID=A0A3V2NXT4_SALET|nr:hypothetical protein [Salmonella enterica subsp. enterica serovar Newport]EAB6120354.1 hypothetical protein [Salmonella enterica subsp. enterica serovar Braenderup]EAB9751131.1 hypothetical protein [Salmonella enterica subsp. salamae]EBZ2217757.1 hypothetical protein [Salmonella enterica subsp. enterica serovar Montevideo]ECD3769724.1 hypothetical protein [Salmonella enterica subsp. enterica serovar Onderstepoort]EEC0577032.1 hypothetical protein [Salmonella enterica]EEC4935151.1 hypotheti